MLWEHFPVIIQFQLTLTGSLLNIYNITQQQQQQQRLNITAQQI